MNRILVIGAGNPFRRDDAAGIEVARRIRDAAIPGLAVALEPGDRLGLLDLWEHADVVFLVDALSGPHSAGTIFRQEVGATPLPTRPRRDSTHALGLGDLIEMARVLGRLPARVVILGIAGEDFTAGTGLSPSVAGAVDEVVAWIARESAAQLAEGGRR